MAVVYEKIPNSEGGRFMDGPRLVARLTTSTQDVVDGPVGTDGKSHRVTVWKEMTPDHWTVHFTSALLHVDVIQAVAKAMPKPA